MIDRYSRAEMAAVWSPQNRFQKWLDVELAITDAWAREGVVDTAVARRIRENARFSVERIDVLEQQTHHDVVAFLGSVQESISEDDARWVHFGVTSSDVVDTALSLLMVESGRLLLRGVDSLIALTAARAVEHAETLMAGRTHGVHAEPITMGLKILLWHEEWKRQRARLEQAIESVRVGKVSGAVGTHATIPPSVQEHVCEALGLQAAPVSSQVLQRDRHAHFATTLALIAGTVEKISLECRHLQRTEVLEAQEPFASGQKGSSSMPHKRNPVGFENLCGLARVVRSNSLAAMENMALWHERDISHSSVERVILPDSCILLDYMMARLERLLKGLVILPKRMRRNLDETGGLLYSQRILLALIDRGLPRPEAYDVVQSAARKVWDEGGTLAERLLEDERFCARLSAADLRELTDPSWYLRHLPEIYRRAGVALTSG
ncbi:MAG: adenylosuccinate lyase [Armatimonadetes bacterium]|nr:adenylosuccinate lyase [Armatimonadota bacterium]